MIIINNDDLDYDVIMMGLHGGPEWQGGTHDKLNDQIILRWVGRYVPEHKATFYQVLALNYIPFHYYVKIPSKNAVAVNMKLFNRKIELGI